MKTIIIIRVVERMYPIITFFTSARRAPARMLIAASKIMSVVVGVCLWYRAWRIIEDAVMDHPSVIRINFLVSVESFICALKVYFIVV